VAPEQVGFPREKSRRVTGLRREEVAVLAGVSADYYTRLEQDRAVAPSMQVLHAIAKALQLSGVEREHLFALATTGVHHAMAATPWLRNSTVEGELRPSMLRVLDALDPASPAFVIGARTRLLAYNALGAALHGDPLTRHVRNEMVWLLFKDRETRALYPDWSDVARDTVGSLRRDAARHPDDPVLTELVNELAESSADFRRWWSEQHVARKGPGLKRFAHPVVGDLTLHYETLSVDDDAQRLIVYTAPAGSPAEETLQLLGTWWATVRRPL
jgi:transcriptional regulator with XRE-family HTH domain